MFTPKASPAPAPSRPAPSDRADRAAVARREAAVDAELVRRFNAGDEAAFVEIVTRYRVKLFYVAQGLLRNRADAEEIAQDALIRAHRGLAQFRGESSLAAWLYCITLNLARNRYWYFFRRRRHASVPLDAVVNEGATSTLADLVACDAPGPVREAANSEFSAVVDACMNRLTPDQREILLLRNVRHQSYGRISRTLGIGLGTVKSRIARARVRLRAQLAKDCPEFAEEAGSFTCFETFRATGHLTAVCA